MSGLGHGGAMTKSWTSQDLGPSYALQMHCPENSKQIFPEKKLRGLNSNSAFMYISVSDLYIPAIGPQTQ
jgi:hypothetical protein